MSKKNRLTLLSLILLMIMCLGAMIWFGIDQSEKQIQTEQKTDYNYQDFASKNAQTTDGVLVLAYHRILKEDTTVRIAQNISKNPQLQQYNVDQSTFVKQMKWLKKNKISVWSMKDFIKHTKQRSIHGKHVVLTFDDIDTTLPRNASSTLYKLNLPFTIFVSTGKVSIDVDGEQMASWAQIEDLAKHKIVTVGLHTNNLHYQVDDHPAISTSKVSRKEMITDYKKSYRKVQQYLDINSNVFAYPYGSQNQSLTTYMANHGMDAIFLLGPGIVTNDDPNILNKVPRFVVTNSNFDQLKAWLK